MSKRYWHKVNAFAVTIQKNATKEGQLLEKIEEIIQKLPNGKLPEKKFEEVFKQVASAAYSIGPKSVQKGNYLRVKLIEFLQRFSKVNGKPEKAEKAIGALIERNNGWSHST
ncbi:MAG: hypothetical protein A3I31_03020 [Candidatus Colwellbacteria bacterium RIFCSPLOWO2_02_FULL_44_20b]|uniref:Uncharacterized protein n=1 Tax=Candidatus Colwellbacteria bacterium RIFCSPLOWO2_02_FULL_44_20b TaxID=1797691 RepID=A0A1G1Z640_9BACT|nr:MAG: hypothetical protein A3I31_03020 [Candidatus Colwellbacteria bacterium RIFCSPLOWO2_02_FULL_44_20b]